MSWYNNLKIKTKLMVAFVFLSLILISSGVYSMIKLKALDNADTAMYEQNVKGLEYIGSISINYQRIRVNLRDIILETSAKDMQQYENNLTQLDADFRESITKYKNAIKSNTLSSKVDDMIKDYEQYNSIQNQIITLAKQNKNKEALNIIKANLSLANRVRDGIDNLVIATTKAAKEKSNNNTNNANSAVTVNIILVILGTIVSLVIGFIISNLISNPINKLKNIADKLAMGDVDVNVEISNNDEIGELSKSFNRMIENTKEQVNVVKKIANGEHNIIIDIKSDKDILGKELNSMLVTLKELMSELNILINATEQGKLQTRGNKDKFNGSWSDLVGQVNRLIEAFVAPIKVTQDYVDKISKGTIPPVITDTYNGDFNDIKSNLNNCIYIMNELLKETNTLINAAQDGKLDTRANANKFAGGWHELVAGVNELIDKVVEPVKEASNVLVEMSKGNLHVSVNGNYKGDHALIKNSLNDTIETLLSYVTEIENNLTKMANGDLDAGIEREYRGDFISIKDSINNIVTSFNELLSEMNNAAYQVAAGSNNVADASQNLSQSSTEQASSLEEITSSITQIAAQTRQNTVNAQTAKEFAEKAKDMAQDGNMQMSEMLKSMNEINTASGNISKIIKVIDEIAFQTNILALNAAVEAARAGQHGKGFAVVAEEVRNLAARSANAAKETTTLIEGSIEKVQSGTGIANKTAESLNEIVMQVNKATELVGDIADASTEASTGVDQINQAIEQVSEVVQGNTATSEETASASEELSSQAETLKAMVAKFKLKGEFNNSYGLVQEANRTSKNKKKINLNNQNGFGKY